MARDAHLLLQADPGRAEEVAAHLNAHPGVTEAIVTSGAYDVIARVDLDQQDLPHVLLHARRAPGLCGVRVCQPS